MSSEIRRATRVANEVGLSWASSPAVRNVMRGNRGRDTLPELALRQLLHSRGYRYRVHRRPLKDLNRRADIVIAKWRIAVFVDGCFWHGCPRHFAPPSTNFEYWQGKIARNRARDAETTKALRRRGWTVIRVWEHETPVAAAGKVERALARAKRTQSVRSRESTRISITGDGRCR